MLRTLTVRRMPMVLMALLLMLRSSPTSQAARTAVDACALLTNAEIEHAVGAATVGRKATSQPTGSLLMSQCFFGSSWARSVSLAVAGPPTGRKVTPAEYWRRQFDRAEPGERDRLETDRDRSAEEESPARAIPGVGDEAYWAGNRITGALYVLRGDAFLRISVGGIRDEAGASTPRKRWKQRHCSGCPGRSD